MPRSPAAWHQGSVAIWRSVLIALLVLSPLRSIVAQTGDNNDPLKLPRDMLVAALNARTAPLRDVKIPGGTVTWKITYYSQGDGNVIITYAFGDTRCRVSLHRTAP
jgi:hypothetical protein